MLVKLKDLITIKNGADYKHLSSGNVPVIGTGGIMLYVNKALYNKEAILLPRKGSLNNVMYINTPFWTVDTMFYAIPNCSKVDPKYLYYHLSLINFARYDIGSTIPSMTASLYYSLVIDLPPIDMQKKISFVLSLIDNQIDRNNTITKRLQVLSHNIFLYYFNNSEKKNEKLKNIANMYQPETIVGSEFVDDGKYYVYGSGGIIGKYNKYNHEESELMVSCRGKCGNVTLSMPCSWIIGNQMVIKPYDAQLKYYLYNYLQIIDLSKVETGSVQKQITRTNLENIIVPLADDDNLLKLAKVSIPIHQQLIKLRKANEKLEELKKKLLPLLINQHLN